MATGMLSEDDRFSELVDMYGEKAVSVEIDRHAKRCGFTGEFMQYWSSLRLRDKNLILSQFDVYWTEMIGSCDHRLLSRLEMYSA